MSAMAELEAPDGKKVNVNPAWIIRIEPKVAPIDPDAQPPQPVCTLILAGGRKDQEVKGSLVEVTKTIDRGMR